MLTPPAMPLYLLCGRTASNRFAAACLKDQSFRPV